MEQLFRVINQPIPVKGLDIGISIIIPINGKGFISQGSTLVDQVQGLVGVGFDELRVWWAQALMVLGFSGCRGHVFFIGMAHSGLACLRVALVPWSSGPLVSWSAGLW